MDDVVADLRSFYDQDAHRRAGRELHGPRLVYRERFLDAIGPDGCSVLEVGCGPGKDAQAFVAAGHRYAGLDLSVVHARYTLAVGAPAVHGSLMALPVADDAIDAAWSMSTYMHVPDDDIEAALDELARVVRPGGLIGIGTWGGLGTDVMADDAEFDPPRFFALRHHDRMRAHYRRLGRIEHEQTLPPGTDGWEYLFVILRLG